MLSLIITGNILHAPKFKYYNNNNNNSINNIGYIGYNSDNGNNGESANPNTLNPFSVQSSHTLFHHINDTFKRFSKGIKVLAGVKYVFRS